MAKIITDVLAQQVIDFYYPGYCLQLVDVEPRDQLKEAQTATNLFKSGILTLNEARSIVGKPSIGSEGEVFLQDLSTGDTDDF